MKRLLEPILWLTVTAGLAVDRTYHDEKWLGVTWALVAGLALAHFLHEWRA